MTDDEVSAYPIAACGPLRYLEHSQPDLASNLALDEALLQEVEDDAAPGVVRIWESPSFAVVLGASGKLLEDVHLDACRADGVAIGRRASGGGTVVIGPGALNAAVVLPLEIDPALAAVDRAQRSVLECLATRLRAGGWNVDVRGSGDLTLGARKVAGSAQRRLRRHFLIHTTILYDFPLDRISRYTALPRRQPTYREGRPHEDFVANLPIGRSDLITAIREAWNAANADVSPTPIPWHRVETLVREKYGDSTWIERF